ncbi:MAG: SDR family NAD(P)-dependent oxidoreductase [Propionibacterium sp.]|nr:SDR family NAD(P)-dependent oxidoreductase [Propionibacterium sp.]
MHALSNKVALVTGSSRGIGRAIAQRFAAEGATVVVTARSLHGKAHTRAGEQVTIEGTLAETVALIEDAGGRAFPIVADLERAEDREGLIERVIAEFGRIDILVNNAGFSDYAMIENLSTETFDRTIDHYLRSPVVLTQKAIPHMRAQGAGWIVNIGSSTGMPPVRPYRDYNRTAGEVLYASVKAALHRFTEGVAAELESDNIAVNVVAPSTAIMTPGAAALIPDTMDTEPVEYLVQTVLEMCTVPAAERTGRIAFSMHYPYSQNVPVMSLDGTEELPRRAPFDWANPNIVPSGLQTPEERV